MLLSKNLIAVLAILATILTPLAVTHYIYSPEIIRNEFSPPNKIFYNGAGILHFELTNHGEKTGSYILYIESKEFLIYTELSKSNNQVYKLDDDYKHYFLMNYLMPKDANHPHKFNIKVNKTNLKPIANISLNYIDKSGFNPIKKEYIWNFYYERDSSNNYQLINEEYFEENIIFLNETAYIRLSDL